MPLTPEAAQLGFDPTIDRRADGEAGILCEVVPTLLTIAGFDPSSGAGITADLMVFAALGCFGTSCITALTVQSTLGVRDVLAIEAATVTATLDCLEEDLPPAGIKIGMLGGTEVVCAVSGYLRRIRGARSVSVVLDPVLRSSSDKALLTPDGIVALRQELLPLVDWITPNLNELAVLTGRAANTRPEILEAAKHLRSLVPRLNVLVTGGHMDPPDDLLLEVGAAPRWIVGERIITRATHGTGCALSSALLARQVLGDDGLTAARFAKQYVRRAIETAPQLGSGAGPLNALWSRKKLRP